ncbi:hypothetical protein D3C86_2191820 [compost metagenome]
MSLKHLSHNWSVISLSARQQTFLNIMSEPIEFIAKLRYKALQAFYASVNLIKHILENVY